jgi:hypothetical protein
MLERHRLIVLGTVAVEAEALCRLLAFRGQPSKGEAARQPQPPQLITECATFPLPCHRTNSERVAQMSDAGDGIGDRCVGVVPEGIEREECGALCLRLWTPNSGKRPTRVRRSYSG